MFRNTFFIYYFRRLMAEVRVAGNKKTGLQEPGF